ncbi:hypothetical protein H9W95_20065 [Flavobacterium lindanitolerans]|nr:hypothetical protein [Flavobacterium lindanitolerans]
MRTISPFPVAKTIAQEQQPAPEKPKHEFWHDKKLYLNEDGSNYLKFAMLSRGLD